MPTVLCDSGPLIALAKIGRLHLLVDLWEVIQVTEEVYREAATSGYKPVVPDALIIRLFCQSHKLPIVAVPQHILESYQPTITLDPGEHATFAYALTLGDVLVLVDDEDARNEARRLGLPVRGTIGVLVEAYRRGLITLSEIELLFNEISERADIWISANLCTQVLKSLRSE